MLRILHASDIQVRNFQRHQEFLEHFQNFYNSARKNKPDHIVLTGDIAHSKTHVSAELFKILTDFFVELATIAPLHIIAGNHDLSLNNLSRLDVITPIVNALNNPNIYYYKHSGVYPIDDKYNFVVFSCIDEDKWTRKEDVGKSKINIGLYHGMVKGAVLQNGQVVEDCPYTIDEFLEIVDFLLMGDIHKQQIFAKYRAAYAGSLIQQNFGESTEKGYLLWDIKSKDDWEVDFVKLPNVCPFYTLDIPDSLEVQEGLGLQAGARIRLLTRQLIGNEEDVLRTKVFSLYKPKDVFVKDDKNAHRQEVKVVKNVKIEDLTDLGVQEKLIRKFLEPYEVSDEIMSMVLKLNQKYDSQVRQEEDIVRNIQYKFGLMKWDNLFSYGESNSFDFSRKRGIVGIFGKNAVGKALDLETEIPTPSGWKTVASVVPGDLIFGDDGKPTKVIAKSPVFRNRQCYEVEFSDGAKVVCDAEHLWTVQDHFARAKKQDIYQTLTTRNLKKTIIWRKKGKKSHNGYEWSVDLAKPVEYENLFDFEIHPYVLGAWLGDGTSSGSGFTCKDVEIVNLMRLYGEDVVKNKAKHQYCVKGLKQRLRRLEVLNNKHIPDIYLQSSIKNRRLLLAGLLDTDGHCGKNGHVEFCSTNKRLAEQTCELICSLGYKATLSEGDATLNGRIVSKKYRVQFSSEDNVFALERKNHFIRINQSGKSKRRFITGIKKVKRRNVQCLVVDNSSHLFLITRKFIPTHNSSLAVDIPLYTMFNTNSKHVVKNDQLINDKKNFCRSSLNLHLGDKIYHIERNTSTYLKSGKRKGKPVYQGKTDLKFHIFDENGNEVENKDGLERGDTDKEIRKVFGIAEDFLSTSVAAQWRLLDFINKKTTERQKTIARFFDVDVFDKKHKIANDDAKDKKAELKRFKEIDFESQRFDISQNVDKAQNVLNQQLDLLDDLQGKQHELKLSIGNKKAELIAVSSDNRGWTDERYIAEIQKKKASCLNKKNEIDNLESKYKQTERTLESLLEKIDAFDSDSLEREINDLRKQCEGKNIYGKLSQITGTIERNQKSIDRLKKYKCISNVNCCMLNELKKLESEQKDLELQKAEVFSIVGEYAELTNKLELLEDELEDYRENVNFSLNLTRNLKNQQKLIDSAKSLLDKMIEEVKNLEADRERLLENKKALIHNEAINQEIKGLEAELEAVFVDITDVSQNIATSNQDLNYQKKRLADLDKQEVKYRELLDEYEAYEHYLRVVGKSGLSQLIVRNNLGLINDEIKKILSGKVNFDIEVQTDEDGREIEIYFSHERSRPRQIELCSGMEKTIASIAIRAAMVGITTLPKANIFVLDEVFSSLDPEYVDATKKILQYLKNLFDSVIIITHIDAFKDLVDHVIQIERDEEGFARLMN